MGLEEEDLKLLPVLAIKCTKLLWMLYAKNTVGKMPHSNIQSLHLMCVRIPFGHIPHHTHKHTHICTREKESENEWQSAHLAHAL